MFPFLPSSSSFFSFSIYAEFNDFLFSLFGKLKFFFLSPTNSKDKPIKLDPKTYNLHLLNTKSLFVRYSIIISTQSSKFILCFMLLLEKSSRLQIFLFFYSVIYFLSLFFVLFNEQKLNFQLHNFHAYTENSVIRFSIKFT